MPLHLLSFLHGLIYKSEQLFLTQFYIQDAEPFVADPTVALKCNPLLQYLWFTDMNELKDEI